MLFLVLLLFYAHAVVHNVHGVISVLCVLFFRCFFFSIHSFIQPFIILRSNEHFVEIAMWLICFVSLFVPASFIIIIIFIKVTAAAAMAAQYS